MAGDPNPRTLGVAAQRLAACLVAMLLCVFHLVACGGSNPTPPAVNQAPTFTTTPTIEARVDQPYLYTIGAADADGDSLSFQLMTGLPWLSLSPLTANSARLGGTPGAADAGGASVTVRVSDGQASSDQSFTIQVDTLPTPVIEVTSSSNDGAGSLRDALLRAGVGNIITFAPGVDTIRLTKAVKVERSLRIIGPGPAALTILGDGTDRLVRVEVNTAVVEISGLTLQGGFTSERGAAVHSHGEVILRDIHFFQNRALKGGGALESDNRATVDNAVFEQNNTEGVGGAIYNWGQMEVTGASFSENTALGDGGAFYNRGGTTLTSVTFVGNRSGQEGGAIASPGTLTVSDGVFVDNSADSHGGAVQASGRSFLSHSLFADNRTGGDGGGLLNTGTMDVDVSAFLGNEAQGQGGAVSARWITEMHSVTAFGNRAALAAGGFHAHGPLAIGNTLAANNTTGFGVGPDGTGEIQSLGYVFLGDSTDVSLVGEATNTLAKDPLIERRGTGVASAVGILDGSPILDTGVCFGETTDRNGLPRPVDLPNIPNTQDGCDIGAYERQN